MLDVVQDLRDLVVIDKDEAPTGCAREQLGCRQSEPVNHVACLAVELARPRRTHSDIAGQILQMCVRDC